MIRDFRREAPGRTRNSASKIKIAAATRRLEEKNFTSRSRKTPGSSSHKLESSSPAGLVEEMHDHFAHEKETIAPGSLEVLPIRSFKRPVDKHRPPDNIFLGNKSPVAAVQTHSAVVAHGEVMAGRYDDVLALNIRREIDHPVRRNVGIIGRRYCRKIVAVGVHGIAVMQDVRFVQRLAVAVDDPVAQVDPVSGDPDDPLYDIQSRFRRG